MGIREKLSTIRDFQTVLLLFLLIILVSGGLFWMGLSIYANIVETRVDNGLPKMPAASKAQYQLQIRTTGDILLCDKYEVEKSPNNPDMLKYTLDGFYRIVDDRWRYTDDALPLDEYYFGKILLEMR